MTWAITDLDTTAGTRPASRPGLREDLNIIGGAGHAGRLGRVAIASYEFNGVVRNGGIGTACTSLALALAEDGHRVDLVFTGWADEASDKDMEHWRGHYAQAGVSLHWLDYATVAHWDTVLYNARHSLALYRLLRELEGDRPYDAIHLVESLGHGYYPVVAKRAGLAFKRATMVMGVHSPRRWLAEAHNVAFDEPVELGDEFMERRSIELSDVVVAPSAHMLDWLERRGVRLPERSYVQQYVTTFDVTDGPRARASSSRPARSNGSGSTRAAAPDRATSTSELVFFGRLEPRKGLMVFCDALDELAAARVEGIDRVTFLGKQVILHDGVSGDYLAGRARRWPWEWQLIDDLDRPEALDYLRGRGRLAVIASSMDNSPNTVYEAIGLGIPFLASRGGGTPELVHSDDVGRVTYDPCDPTEVEIDPGEPCATRPRHTGVVLADRLRRALATPPAAARFAVDPALNRARHLAWHRAVAARPSEPETPPAHAVPLPVAAPDLAAVDPAGGPVLVVDPDAELAPAASDVLAQAAERNPGTALFTGLGSFAVATPEGPIERLLLPTGGPPAVGTIGNCFGAGAVLVRADALERLGVVGAQVAHPVASVGDLLARAALAGERAHVLPEVLYHLPASAAPTGSLSVAASPLEALRPYHAVLAAPVRDVASAACRLARERDAAVTRAELAERRADDFGGRLGEVLASRSFRMMAPARRLVARLRALRARGG